MAGYDDLINAASAKYGVDPDLPRAMMQQESRGNPNAVSRVGASGLMQLMPATAKELGVTNIFDPAQNIDGGVRYLSQLLGKYGDVEKAVQAYNMGPGAFDKYQAGERKLPGETADYLGKVSTNFANLKKGIMPQQQPTQNTEFADAFWGSAPSQPKADTSFADAFWGAPAMPAGKAAPMPAQAQPVAAQTAPQQLAQVTPQGQPVPGAFTMGVGDVVKGGVQSLAHGIGALAERYPNAARALNFLTGGDINADVAADFRRGTPQVDAQIAQQERAYQAQRPADAGIDWARLGGNVAGAAPLAALTPGMRGASLVDRAVLGTIGAGFGTIAAPITDETRPFAEQKKEQLALAAALGGAAPAVTAGIGGAVRGVTDPVRQRLAAAGVQMTPGQILGGALQRTEEKLTSVPVLGDFIKGAQRRSLDSFNRATYNSALEPLGTAIPDNVATGSEAVNHVRRAIGNVYQGIQPRASFVADQNFATDLAAVRNELAQNAPGALAQFDNIVQNQITAKLRNNAMNGDQWGNTRSTITRIARDRLIGNSTPDDRVLASALDDLGDAVNAAVGRASPPDVLPTLGRANAAWAQYKQIERAAGSVGASNNANVFTAAQFANAVRRGSTSAQRATNTGLNAQLAGDAADVLGAKYPDSGTVGRSLLTLGTGALAGQTVAPGVVLPAAAAIGVGSLPYTATGQRLAQVLLMNRPAGAQAAGNAIANMGPRLGALLAPSMLLKP